MLGFDPDRRTRCGPAVTLCPPAPPRIVAPRYDRRAPADRAAGKGRRWPRSTPCEDRSTGRDLGRTLMHEHIFVLSPEIEKTADEWDEAAEQARAVTKLRELKEHGIDTLVDLTVVGLGRYIPRVAAIAEQVPEINVVVATGVYTYNEVPMYFHFRGPGTDPRRARADGGPLRARDPRGDRRDGGAGRHPQVRVRPPRHHARRRARAASRGAGAPGHRGADHHAHADAARALGPRAAAHLQGGGRRPDPGRHRPQRRAPSTPTTT